MGELIISQDFGAVRQLTMNSPEKLNALSDAMLDALNTEFDALERDQETIRVAVIRGAGKAFCAGHDLKEMRAGRDASDKGHEYLSALFSKCSSVMTRIHHLPQPLIAQVHGIATAAGCQLVATCDLAVAADDTRFGVNGVNIGLFCSTPMVALSRNIPRKKAFEMLTTGEFISAVRAEQLGLVNRVTPVDELDDATMELANVIASKLGTAVRIGKRAFYEQLHLSEGEAYDLTARVMVENMADEDTVEGIDAFLQKRAPNWAQ